MEQEQNSFREGTVCLLHFTLQNIASPLWVALWFDEPGTSSTFAPARVMLVLVDAPHGQTLCYVVHYIGTNAPLVCIPKGNVDAH